MKMNKRVYFRFPWLFLALSLNDSIMIHISDESSSVPINVRPEMNSDTHTTQNITMFWYDLYEDNGSQSCLYLFGKLYQEKKPYQNVCVKIQHIPRTMYILPRKKDDNTRYSIADVIGGIWLKKDHDCIEIRPFAIQHHINPIQYKLEPMKYAFEIPDIDPIVFFSFDFYGNRRNM